VAGAEGGGVPLPTAAGLDGLGGVAGVDDELDDDEQPATEARMISAAAVPRIPLRERSTLGNNPVPPLSWRHMRRPAKYDCRAGTRVGAGPVDHAPTGTGSDVGSETVCVWPRPFGRAPG
jgi:hypothetical protein